MVTFETIEKHEHKFSTVGSNRNHFMQVARKVAKDESGKTVFVALTRGYFKSNSRRYKNNLTIPDDPELIRFVIDSLEELLPEGQ